jgi:hypothetical protein
VLLAIVLINLIVLAPSFLLTFAAPNPTWLAVAALTVGGLFLYKGLAATGEPCGYSLMAFAAPEPSDSWLASLLALAVGAVLRGLTMLAGGRSGAFSVRIPLAVATLCILSLFSYGLIHSIESLIGVSSCSGA